MKKGEKILVKTSLSLIISTSLVFSSSSGLLVVSAEDSTEITESTEIIESTEAVIETTTEEIEEEVKEEVKTIVENNTVNADELLPDTDMETTVDNLEVDTYEINSLDLTDEYGISTMELTVPDGAVLLSGAVGKAFAYSDGTLEIIEGGEAADNNGYSWFGYETSTRKIIVDEGVDAIGYMSFYQFSNLEEVIIAESVTTVGGSAFSECDKLSHLVVKGNNTTFLSGGSGYGPFRGNLKPNINSAGPLGSGCDFEFGWTDKISDYAFSDLPITSVIIPDSITAIGNAAFRDCENLSEVVIYTNVTNIGYWAFTGCSNLSHLVIKGQPTLNTSSTGFSSFWNSNSKLYTAGMIGSGCDFEYGWTESIPNYAFAWLNNLTTITLPDGISSIGNSAFRECNSLQEILIPATVGSIGYWAFNGCESLSHMVINGTPTFGNNGAEQSSFYDCRSKLYTAGTIGSGCNLEFANTESIPDNMFKDLSCLTSVEMPSSITSIGIQSFRNCSGITTIVLPESLQTIGLYGFYECTSLNNITTSKNITSIGRSAFFTPVAIDTTVTSNNGVVKSYNWSGDNRTVAFSSFGGEVTDIDVTINTNIMAFNIENNEFSSNDVVITNNGNSKVSVKITDVEKVGQAPDIVSNSKFSDWSAITEDEVKNNIALMINNYELATAFGNTSNSSDKHIMLGDIKAKESIDVSTYTEIMNSGTLTVASGTPNGAVTKTYYFGNVGNGAENYVTYKVNAPYGGTYNMSIFYGSGNRTIYVSVNGGAGTEIYCSEYGGYANGQIVLDKGLNEIKLYNDTAYGPDLGDISLTRTVEIDTAVETPAEVKAENEKTLSLSAKYGDYSCLAEDLVMNYKMTLQFDIVTE